MVWVSCDRRDQRPPHPFSGGVDAAEAATGAERMRVSAMIKCFMIENLDWLSAATSERLTHFRDRM